MTTKTNRRLQEVVGGCFVWEELPDGWARVDFFDSIYLAKDVYPDASTEPVPPTVITDLEKA